MYDVAVHIHIYRILKRGVWARFHACFRFWSVFWGYWVGHRRAFHVQWRLGCLVRRVWRFIIADATRHSAFFHDVFEGYTHSLFGFFPVIAYMLAVVCCKVF